ncbi:MAG: hypothetical protein HY072_09135 [Deltaproteobacteria bacterium]|nr:hypothetical protein [Deltaproteobacteria bacterium]
MKIGKFRQDLYFRLSGFTIKLPPLRERKDDIELLAKFFIHKEDILLSQEALILLQHHSWPGNVRELEQVIKRALVFVEGNEILAKDLEFDDSVKQYQDQSEKYQELNFYEAQMEFSKEFINKALNNHEQDRTRTAAHLGISERTLYRILSER